jgi:hypothetical protein
MIVYVLFVHKKISFKEKSLYYSHKKLKIKKKTIFSVFFMCFWGVFWVGFLLPALPAPAVAVVHGSTGARLAVSAGRLQLELKGCG